MRLWRDAHLRLSITRLGLVYLGVLLSVGFFAANTSNNLLYLVFGWMGGLFLVSGWVSRKALREFVPQSVEAPTLFARVKGGLRIRFQDRAPTRMRALELRVELDSGTAEPTFHPGGTREPTPRITFQVRPDHRGPLRIRSLELRTRYPFGFLEKAWRFDWDEVCLVAPHPRVGPLKPETEGDALGARPQAGSTTPEGTRPLRPGDPLSRIHWKRTAQRGKPWIRTFEDEVPQGLRLRLDLTAWSPGPPFEAELERLSGLILQARIQKRAVLLELQTRKGSQCIEGHGPAWRALAEAQAEGPQGTVQGPRSDLP